MPVRKTDLVPFKLVLAVEGTETVDGRMVVPGALWWLTPGQQELATVPVFHDGQIVGIVDSIWRDGDVVKGSGAFIEGRVPENALGNDVGMTIDNAEFDPSVVSPITVTKARIRNVWIYGLTQSGAWPEAKVTEVGE